MRQGPTIHVAVLLLAAILPAAAARAQEHDPGRAIPIKAGMLVNFVRYTSWPASSFADEGSPIVVTIVGDPAMADALVAATRGQTVSGRSVEIRRARDPAAERAPRAEEVSEFHRALRASHAVYIGDAGPERLDATLDALRGADVLTVSSLPRFAERGGMFGFAVRDGRIAFDVNEEAIRSTRLQVSSQVLKLARIVSPDRKPEDKP